MRPMNLLVTLGGTHLAAALCVLLMWATAATTKPLIPFDEAYKDSSFAAFRDEFVEVVAQRDLAELHRYVAPDVRIFFDDPGGFEALVKKLEAHPELWDKLLEVLTKGGRYREEDGQIEFIAPYTFFVGDDDDDQLIGPPFWEFGIAAVIGVGIAVRQRPDLNSPAIATLSYEVVKVLDWGDGPKTVSYVFDSDEAMRTPPRWARIALLGGGEGYLLADFLRSPTDYRAYFAKRNGMWVMDCFIAGD